MEDTFGQKGRGDHAVEVELREKVVEVTAGR